MIPFLPELFLLWLICPWEAKKKHEGNGEDYDDDCIAFLQVIFIKFLKAQSYTLKSKFMKL